MAPLLELTIRRKLYRRTGAPPVEAVRDLVLGFPTGTVTALLGPSGCGKTTALRILMGLDQDYEGEVRYRPQRLGVVFQEPRLLPWRTLGDNMRIVAAAAGLPEPPVEALLARVGLAGWAGHLPRELSLGMARRAAIARALAVEPELLVLDEPFVSLDEATAAQLRALVAEVLAERRATAVLVTHALEDAAELADRVAVLSPRPARLLRLVEVPRGDVAGLRAALATA
ncbi:ABC transporter ATP-binding protein [Paracraurococcus lichenis]|uniref:ATP-binding cassette domain-containing protein n=1 Tax=Paracraurococcus lichenis TaxID=3064888 RepID=A0ABT9E0Q0_9PROT|nr:ATP-binding cassette domain-containing protein [Paracraurococcus sp. LOR1-02]MDO9709724.1 ATP-binding cassette domain-containing protein [Paracraurococcus sp. LOR1-02]